MHGGRSRAVVEDGQLAVRLHNCVMLEGGPGARSHPEARVPPAKLPQHRSVVTFDVIDSVGVTHRDDQVPVRIERNGVGVERVENAPGHLVPVLVGVIDAEVIQGVPLEQHEARADVDLLHERVQDGAVSARQLHRCHGDDVRVP